MRSIIRMSSLESIRDIIEIEMLKEGTTGQINGSGRIEGQVKDMSGSLVIGTMTTG